MNLFKFPSLHQLNGDKTIGAYVYGSVGALAGLYVIVNGEIGYRTEKKKTPIVSFIWYSTVLTSMGGVLGGLFGLISADTIGNVVPIVCISLFGGVYKLIDKHDCNTQT